jgi:hypothetical protein
MVRPFAFNGQYDASFVRIVSLNAGILIIRARPGRDYW